MIFFYKISVCYTFYHALLQFNFYHLQLLRPGLCFFKIFILSFAVQIVNRIQKLRKKVALEPTDTVEVYFESLDDDKSVSQRVLHSQVRIRRSNKWLWNTTLCVKHCSTDTLFCTINIQNWASEKLNYWADINFFLI